MPKKQQERSVSKDKLKAQKKIKKEKKAKRAKKDENAPKRGLTAFLHFVQNKMKSYKESHKDLSHNELWKTISQKEKQPFEDLAKRDKDRYTKEKKEYDQQNSKKSKSVDKKKK